MEHNNDDHNTNLQAEMPFAIVAGETITELPADLYIPPHALEVFLDAFEGPLDLLLYLIRKQNLDILDIPVAPVCEQYMTYIDLMKGVKLELAAEYLVMAAMLAEIKSRMLLPRPQSVDEEEDDPRAQLVRRLQEYERYRKAGQEINDLPRVGRELVMAVVEYQGTPVERPRPTVTLDQLLNAFKKVVQHAELFKHHHIQREALSVRERMTRIMDLVGSDNFVNFEALFDLKEGRMGVVVTFLAILELLKESLITVVQQEPFAPIHIKTAA
ncbi:MAG: ScpA family protein [Acidiferrobacterales bacterium]